MQFSTRRIKIITVLKLLKHIRVIKNIIKYGIYLLKNCITRLYIPFNYSIWSFIYIEHFSFIKLLFKQVEFLHCNWWYFHYNACTNTWMPIAIRKLHSSFFTFSVVQTLYDDGSVHPLWLLWLAVALGILFLIMLIINIFLCSAMTCSCTRTDIIEKEPSIIEDYDPYRSWHGSQYGSRFDLITSLKRIAWLADKVSLLIASIIYDYVRHPPCGIMLT